MKISELAKHLLEAKKAYGNVEVVLIDAESGHHVPILKVYPKHPLGSSGGWDRSRPVDGIVLTQYRY